MTQLQRVYVCALSILAASGLAASGSLHAQVGDPATLIKEKLGADIKLTKITAAHDDIVTAGDVVLLHKDGLMMCSTASSYAYSNTYQNGVIAGNLNNRAKDAVRSIFKSHMPFGGGGSASDAANNACPSRKFVSGEKFWITDIEIAKDNSGIIISTFSDPYNDVRYYGEIKFPFPSKNSVPPVDEEVKTVEEVLTVAPSDDSGGNGGNGGSGGGQSQAQNSGPSQPQNSGPSQAQNAPAPASSGTPAAALAPIAPPPPPPDQPPPPPKTISVGQSIDQVVAVWGKPSKDIKLGSKEIYVYPDMKVTFVGGKVSDVE
ncbi:MAG TPA: hypothetical protein VME23_13315 [Terracidiphilus sp.]|nr:hypothetical protein [Terracidiphilus sp.]